MIRNHTNPMLRIDSKAPTRRVHGSVSSCRTIRVAAGSGAYPADYVRKRVEKRPVSIRIDSDVSFAPFRRVIMAKETRGGPA